jgi:high-affinity nickel-transport protein
MQGPPTPPGDFASHFKLNTAGFVIVGMFIFTWLDALFVWRSGRIDEKWAANRRLGPR